MLKEKLDAMVEQSASKIPAEFKAVMGAATQKVTDSIATRSIPSVGGLCPDFELADSRGNVVKSTDLLQESGLILSFFRGGW